MTLLSACLGVSGVVSDPGFYKKKRRKDRNKCCHRNYSVYQSCPKDGSKEQPCRSGSHPGIASAPQGSSLFLFSVVEEQELGFMTMGCLF